MVYVRSLNRMAALMVAASKLSSRGGATAITIFAILSSPSRTKLVPHLFSGTALCCWYELAMTGTIHLFVRCLDPTILYDVLYNPIALFIYSVMGWHYLDVVRPAGTRMEYLIDELGHNLLGEDL
jgi:hypothetical protein